MKLQIQYLTHTEIFAYGTAISFLRIVWIRMSFISFSEHCRLTRNFVRLDITQQYHHRTTTTEQQQQNNNNRTTTEQQQPQHSQQHQQQPKKIKKGSNSLSYCDYRLITWQFLHALSSHVKMFSKDISKITKQSYIAYVLCPRGLICMADSRFGDWTSLT